VGRLLAFSWRSLVFLAVLLIAAAGFPDHGRHAVAVAADGPSQALSAEEFSRLIQDFSEEDGYFRSDNFTSNETSYLHIIDKLHQLNVSGGAYIGVGPEQNFTYIAKIRPRIAFIIDIRRQAIIQHLIFKAIFHQAATPAQFLSLLLSRPISGPKAPTKASPIADLVEYFSAAASPDDFYNQNLARIKKSIQQEFHFPLSARDQMRLEYVFSSFRKNGLGISFQFGGWQRRGYGGWFPTFSDLLLQTDSRGLPGNFLANENDYRFVRQMHLQNRIIPIVGDFAGTKALASIAAYLVKNGYKVSAYYTSNVEQFLFQGEMFEHFLANVRKLPVDDRSVFIRAVVRMGLGHPANVPGHGTTTLLQKISVFLEDQNQRPYPDYWELVTTHYIVGTNPSPN
jgi:hypothetical protein